MLLQNGSTLRIDKTYYNKSHVQEDGITQIIDTEHKYPMYTLHLYKNYMDINDNEQVVNCIIEDLQTTIQELQQILEQNKEEQEEER